MLVKLAYAMQRLKKYLKKYQPDLSVQMSESLKFEKQISNNVVQKANGVIASIRRTFTKIAFQFYTKVLLDRIKSIVTPYGVHIWLKTSNSLKVCKDVLQN